LGVVFNKGFLWFGLWGCVAGLIISLLFVSPVIAMQKTKERIKDIVFASGFMWAPIAFVIGGAGIIAWIIKLFI